MKTETKNLDKCRVQLTVTLDADEAKACVKEVEKTFLREARLPGFRPGKAPIEIVRKEFGSQLKTEIERTAFRKYYTEAVKAEKIDEVAIAEIPGLACDNAGGSFTVVVEVPPKFKLPTYKGLKISEKDTKVEDSAVAAQIKRLREAYAKFEDAKDGEAVADGDFVQIDYAGTVDGKPVAEIAPDAKVVATGTGFWTQVEEGRFIPEVLEALKGMKAGETKEDVKVKFDKEAAPEALRGKKALYNVTLKSFRRRILPTDEEFATLAKAESFEKLEKDVREAMEKQAIAEEKTRRENEAVDLLMKKVDFDVPESQVRHATDNYLNNLAQRAQYAGLSAEYFEKNRDQIMKDATDMATRQVRLWYVLDGIAKEEKIEAKDDEKGRKVIEFVIANAKK